HDQGRHRQRSLENRGYHQGQSRGGRGCGLRRDAHLDAAWRTNRAPRLRRLSSEAAQARHRSQPENGQRSSDPSGPDDPVQAGQRPSEYRLSLEQPVRPIEPAQGQPDLAPGSPPDARGANLAKFAKFRDRIWLHVLLFVLTILTTYSLAGAQYSFTILLI